jgi:formiminoglutamase
VLEEDGLAFTKFEWSILPKDPNDRLFGTLVSGSVKLEDCDVVLLGLPFDGATLGRLGAAEGPKALRTALRNMKIHRFNGPRRLGKAAGTSDPDAKGVLFVPAPGDESSAGNRPMDLGSEIKTRIVDLGDAVLPVSDVVRAHAEAEKAARCAKLLAKMCRNDNARVISIGGDHSLTFPCAQTYLEEFREYLAVINLDAHLDVRSVRTGEPFNSGTSFGRLLDHGLKTYVVVGARDFQTSPHYIKRMDSAGGRVFTANQVFSKGVEAVCREVMQSLPKRCEAIYLSVDMDVADASVAPGVSAPTPGGLFAHQLLEMVSIFSSDPRVISCDIMELAPRLEEPNSDRTARLAAGCLAHMLANFQTQ